MIVLIAVGVVLALVAYGAGKTVAGSRIENEIEAEFVKIEAKASSEVKSVIASVRAKL